MDIVNGLRGMKRTIASFSLATLVASFFAIGVAQAQTFPDVNPTDWFYSYVEDLVTLGVVNSSMPSYRPGDNVNRAEMAKLVVEAFEIDLVSPETATFKDVAPGTWYYEYVETAYAHGIVGGYKDTEGTLTGFYGPGDSLTREQASKMIVLGAPLDINTNCGPSFPDVAMNQWSYEYVETLYVNSVIDGYPDGSFGPNNNINRAEIAKIVSNAMAPVLRPCGGFSVEAAEAMSATTVEVCYTGEYDETSALMSENYAIEDVDGNELAVSAVEATSDPECVLLTTAAQDSTKVYDLLVTDVLDADGMELLSGDASFNGYTVGNVGDLTVDLDGSSPAAASIPNNGANVLYSVFGFTAGDDEDVEVTQLIITRQGLGLPGDFDNIKLYVDGIQKGSEKTLNTSTNSATFNLTSDPIVVPAGKRVLVEVRADMGGAIHSENQLCIATSDDVTAVGGSTAADVAVGGTFAICGELLTTTSAVVGTLTYTLSQPSTGDINVGDTDVSFVKVKMDEAVEDVNVTRITFKQGGSADTDYFANLHLVMSGSPIDAAVSWEGDYVTFDLSENPIFIAKGNSKTVELRGDVTGGLNTTALFDIYRDWHIEGTGTVYGYGVNVVENAPPFTPTARDIVGGNVAFSVSSNNPVTGDVKIGADDFEFTRFNISTGGDGVTVKKISLTVNAVGDATLANISDVNIWTKNSSDVWYVVAGPNDFNAGVAGTQTAAFTDSFEVPAATTQEFLITADIENTAALGMSYDIDVADVTVAANTELEFLSDGTAVNVATEVTGGLLNGNIMTIAQPQLNVSLAATPGDKTYVRNTTGKDVVAFDMQATSADDLLVTNLVVTCQDTPELGAAANNAIDDDLAAVPLIANAIDGIADEGDGVNNDAVGGIDDGSGVTDPVAGSCSNTFQSLKLYQIDGSTLTQLDSSARTMSNTGSGDGKVEFSLSHTVTKGTTERFLVRSDLSSGAVQDGYVFYINAIGDLTVEDTDGAAATVVGPVTATRQVTVAPMGNMISQGVTHESLMARIVSSASTDEPVLRVKFSADELEAWYVKKMQFTLDGNCDAAAWDAAADPCAGRDLSKINIHYLDNLGVEQTASNTFVNGTVLFEGLNIYVPAGGEQDVEVTLDMGTVAAGGAIAGDAVKVTFEGVGATFQAVGASSATVVAALAADMTSNEIRLTKSYPVLSSNDNVSTAMSADSTLYSLTIAADDNGPIAIKQLCFDVVNGGGGSYGVGSAKIYREGEGTDLEAAGEVDVSEGAGWCGATGMGVLVQWTTPVAPLVGGEDIIAAGSSKTYILKGSVAGALAGDKVTTRLIGDTENFPVGSDRGSVNTATPYTLTDGTLALPATPANFIWSDRSVAMHDADEVVVAGTSEDFLNGYFVEGMSSLVAHEVKF